jgi:hypothetical protein
MMMMAVLMMQWFRYFSFDRRYGVVIETVSEAAAKLVPGALTTLIVVGSQCIQCIQCIQ